MIRLELLTVKADLERELGRLVLDCSSCGHTVHWVAGLGVSSGHWVTGSLRRITSPPCDVEKMMTIEPCRNSA